MNAHEALLKLRAVVESVAVDLSREARVLDYTASRMVGAPKVCGDIRDSLNHHSKTLMEAIRDAVDPVGE